MKRPIARSGAHSITRRSLLAGVGLAAPAVLSFRGALAQDKPRELKVRTWGGIWLESLRKGVSEPFSRETGIPVTHIVLEDYLTGGMILEALKAGRPPPVHVDWNTTINATQLALQGGTVDIGDIAGLDKLMSVARPEGVKGWLLVNTYGYVYALAYREEAFRSRRPNSWLVMVDPKFRGRVGLYDDGIGFYSSAQVAGGGTMAGIPDDMTPCWAFLEKIKANKPLLGKDPSFTQWLEAGSVDVCSTVTANARAARLKGAKVSWTVPREGAEYDTDAMCIPKGLAENELYWAKRYVERAISRQGQEVWCRSLGLPPVYPNTTPPLDMVGDPAYPTTEADLRRLLRIPTSVLVAHQDAWYARYQKLMGEG